jgi:hypothetical protein
MENPIYLGDAVYTFFDGNGIELKLNHHASACLVYLRTRGDARSHCVLEKGSRPPNKREASMSFEPIRAYMIRRVEFGDRRGTQNGDHAN